jgi:hypothetical protein
MIEGEAMAMNAKCVAGARTGTVRIDGSEPFRIRGVIEMPAWRIGRRRTARSSAYPRFGPHSLERRFRNGRRGARRCWTNVRPLDCRAGQGLT